MPPRFVKKRRTDGLNKSDVESTMLISSGRDLFSLMADYSGAGIKSFKNFLNRCTMGTEIEEEEAATNYSILKEYLEAQCRYALKEEDGEMELRPFNDITKVWGYANQNNSISLLSLVPSSLAILIRLCSYHEEFNIYGTTLIHNLLQPSSLKVIYRGLTGSNDQIISPCLRMLTEMNRFNFGAMCGFVHLAFDFTIKDLPRNMEVKCSAKIVVEDPARPSVRTLCVRFFLSFLQNGEPSIRIKMLELRNWVTPLFKHLKTDTPSIIYDVLECLTIKVLAEEEIPRATKTNTFNEWVLSHILRLYTREETVKFSKSGKEEEKRLAGIAHEFLMSACTRRGSGICYPEHGWYPPGYSEKEDKRKPAPKVYNRILSSFVTSIRPFADKTQLDLILAIFETSPELVADHFLSNLNFSFDPKLTSTWMGYCAFLLSVIALPIPRNFGAPEPVALPPPTNVIAENILPKPLGKVVMTKCLTHENSLIRFLSTRLLITAFQKLRSVLNGLDRASASVHDRTESWKKCKFDVVEYFCKRIPDASVVSSGGTKIDANGILQMETKMRLLMNYYAIIPEMASLGKFDVNIALTTFLRGDSGDPSGIRILEIGHLLHIAKDVPDFKWWNKTYAMEHSPFVAMLRLGCKYTSNAPQQKFRGLLHSLASTSYLFQSETTASPLDALLESLSTVGDNENLEAILSLLDEAVARCIRGPFKYLDEYAKAVVEIQKQNPEASGLPPVSPIIMTLAEQWKFFMESLNYSNEQKVCAVKWLLRFLESCVLLGENRYVLLALIVRLTADSGSIPEGFIDLKNCMQKDQSLELASKAMHDGTSRVGIRDLFVALPKPGIDLHIVPVLSKGILNNAIETSVFDLAVVQRAITGIVRSEKIVSADATAAVVKLNELMKYIASQLISQGGKVMENTKRFISKESSCLELFCSTSSFIGRILMIVEVSRGYAELLSTIFEKNNPILETAKERLSSFMLKFINVFQTLPDDDVPTLLLIYRSMISLLYTSADVNCLLSRFCSEPSRHKEGTLPQLLEFILHLSVERGHVIDVNLISRLLKPDIITPRVSSALVAYISGTKIEDLQGINCFETTVPEQMAVVYSLIPKLKTIRDVALNRLNEEIQAGSTLLLTERVSALLEVYSVAIADSTNFDWATCANGTIKTKLQIAFNVTQKELLQTAPNTHQVNVLQRAISLFPSLNRKDFLKRIATNRMRSALTDSTVALVDALVEKSDDACISEMKGWFLMVFDHLTRRFAEDAVLSDKVIAIAMALGKFLARKKVKLENVIPRTTLNAVLEAGLQRHINIPVVVYFVVNVVSFSSLRSLDLAKLLHLVLRHTDNPLSLRGAIHQANEIHHYIAFLISKLFEAGKTSLYTIATLDSLMVLYRGTNHPIDCILLKAIQYIEGHLEQSCASRISSWSVLECTNKPLISRVRGHLEVSIDAKMLATSVFDTVPNNPNFVLHCLDTYLDSIKDNPIPVGKAYNPMFILPALTFCFISKSHVLEAQTAIDRHCFGFAIVCLSSNDKTTRQMAVGFLSTAISKLEDSPYHGKTQIRHLILGLLASLSSQNAQTMDQPLPSATGIFLAQATQVLANPTHFVYENIVELLLRQPLLQLHDLSLILSILQVGEEHYKEVSWILNILSAGLKTDQDLVLYRKCNVFDNILNLYTSPNCSERVKEKVLELLWNAAAIEGGGTTLITRNGVVAWVEQQLGVSQEEDLTLKRLVAKLSESLAKVHVREWSRANLRDHFVGENAKLGVNV